MCYRNSHSADKGTTFFRHTPIFSTFFAKSQLLFANLTKKSVNMYQRCFGGCLCTEQMVYSLLNQFGFDVIFYAAKVVNYFGLSKSSANKNAIYAKVLHKWQRLITLYLICRATVSLRNNLQFIDLQCTFFYLVRQFLI